MSRTDTPVAETFPSFPLTLFKVVAMSTNFQEMLAQNVTIWQGDLLIQCSVEHLLQVLIN